LDKKTKKKPATAITLDSVSGEDVEITGSREVTKKKEED
jgi:hypothetical protein